MSGTDYRQVYKTIERCNAELRGVAHRLHESGDYDASRILVEAIGELDTKLHELVSLGN